VPEGTRVWTHCAGRRTRRAPSENPRPRRPRHRVPQPPLPSYPPSLAPTLLSPPPSPLAPARVLPTRRSPLSGLRLPFAHGRILHSLCPCSFNATCVIVCRERRRVRPGGGGLRGCWVWVRDEQSSVTLGDWRCVWGRDNHKGKETGAARDAGRGGEKETSIELLEQRSGTAYRWDTEIQSSVRVLRQATNPTFESYSEGDTLLDRERACLD